MLRKLFEFDDQWRVFLDSSTSVASSETQLIVFSIAQRKNQPSLPVLYAQIARRTAVSQSLHGSSAKAFERVLEGKVNPDQTAAARRHRTDAFELHACVIVTHCRRDPLDLPDKDCIRPGKECAGGNSIVDTRATIYLVEDGSAEQQDRSGL